MEPKNQIVCYSPTLKLTSDIIRWSYGQGTDKKEVDVVCVIPKFYLLLHHAFSQKLSYEEAQSICQEYDSHIPSKYELQICQVPQEKLARFVSSLGVDAQALDEEDILSRCWNEEDEPNSSDKKYLLLVARKAQDILLIKENKFLLVDRQCLYCNSVDAWEQEEMTLFLGDKSSNLFLVRDDELFLQCNQQLSYIGKCCAFWNNEILLCDNGLYQYYDGTMRCLIQSDISSEKWNNSNSGHEESVYVEKITAEGDLFCRFTIYDWCDNGEQTREDVKQMHFRKDGHGLYQLCE